MAIYDEPAALLTYAEIIAATDTQPHDEGHGYRTAAIRVRLRHDEMADTAATAEYAAEPPPHCTNVLVILRHAITLRPA